MWILLLTGNEDQKIIKKINHCLFTHKIYTAIQLIQYVAKLFSNTAKDSQHFFLF